jgi:methyltransferase-like protein 6
LIYACDFSAKAVDLLKTNEDYKMNKERCFPFQCDIVKENLCEKLENKEMDIVTLIFVLSAIHPKNFNIAIQNVFKVFMFLNHSLKVKY